MKKVLFLTHNCYFVNKFLTPQIELYKSLGYQVDLAASLDLEEPPKEINHFYDIGIKQSPSKLISNFKAYKKLGKLIDNYDVINCHTPMGGVLGRLIKLRKKNLEVVYTAHGFHFFKGSSKLSWLAFYPVEKFLSRFTDKQIVINQEDYQLLFNKNFKSKLKVLINGVGLEPIQVNHDSVSLIKKSLNISDNDIVLISVGQLNNNKNQKFLIEVMSKLQDSMLNLKLLVVGEGPSRDELELLIKQNDLTDRVTLIGYTDQVSDYLLLSDIVVSASYREGLPKNIMEGLYLSKPCLVSDCRGNRDLIKTNYNGYVFEQDNQEDFKIGLSYIINNYESLSKNCYESVTPYLLENVIEDYRKVFLESVSK